MAVESCCCHAHIRAIHVLRTVNTSTLLRCRLVLPRRTRHRETTTSGAIVSDGAGAVVSSSICCVCFVESACRCGGGSAIYADVPRITVTRERLTSQLAVLARRAQHALALSLRVVAVHEGTGWAGGLDTAYAVVA